MYILGFDTSSSYCSVAISSGPNILAASRSQSPNMQAEKLISMIEELLNNNSLAYNDLSHISVTSGPGSFTGIRIGLSAAKGIILSCPSIKPVCINNFETINFRLKQQCTDFDYSICCIDAFRDEIYFQINSNNENRDEGEIYLLNFSDFKEKIESLNGKIVIGGSGISKIYNCLSHPKENVIILPRFPYPDARFVCRVAYQKITKNIVNPNIEPLYIRAPDAKIPLL